jgi:hypothetical protein
MLEAGSPLELSSSLERNRKLNLIITCIIFTCLVIQAAIETCA